MGFADDINAQSKQYGGGGSGSNIYSLNDKKKGTYPIRVLVQPEVLATHFFGKGQPSAICYGMDEGCPHHKDGADRPSIRLITYVIDREDGEIKLAELPLSLSYGIQDLQEDPDYAFEEFPMPYDIKVIRDPDNSDPKAKYRVGAPGKIESITSDQKAELDKQMGEITPAQYVERRKEKQKNKGKDIRDTDKYPQEDINPEDIPF